MALLFQTTPDIQKYINQLDIKSSCRVATTEAIIGTSLSNDKIIIADGVSNFSASGNTFSIDSISLFKNDRILIKNNPTIDSSSQSKWNGIYTVGSLLGSTLTLTRAIDFIDYNDELGNRVTTCDFTFIEEGTTNKGKVFYLSSPVNPVIIGTSNLTFTEFGGGGGGGDGEGDITDEYGDRSFMWEYR